MPLYAPYLDKVAHRRPSGVPREPIQTHLKYGDSGANRVEMTLSESYWPCGYNGFFNSLKLGTPVAQCWHKKAYLGWYLLSLYVRTVSSNKLISNEYFSADCEAIYGEHCIDIAGVTGSIPVVPTIYFKNLAVKPAKYILCPTISPLKL